MLVSVIQRDAHGFHQVAIMQLQQELARAVQRSHLFEQLGPPCFDPLSHQLLPPALGHLCTQDNTRIPEVHKALVLLLNIFVKYGIAYSKDLSGATRGPLSIKMMLLSFSVTKCSSHL